MLGSMAKWLRILGYDTKYVKNMKDEEIAKIAREEERILLTRDKKLASKFKNSIYLENNGLKNQLRRIIKELALEIDDKNLLTRCIICNEKIEKIDKEKVKGMVPEHVYESHEEFYICPKCKRIYWIGTHFKNMKKFIESIKL
ncbi:MAG: Mut7-C RNAse domain-containing protein [Thermoplasmata archaeon]|nr:Mut7-C RNAse domain-containing protein [Thermoplasmata archaeon]